MTTTVIDAARLEEKWKLMRNSKNSAALKALIEDLASRYNAGQRVFPLGYDYLAKTYALGEGSLGQNRAKRILLRTREHDVLRIYAPAAAPWKDRGGLPTEYVFSPEFVRSVTADTVTEGWDEQKEEEVRAVVSDLPQRGTARAVLRVAQQFDQGKFGSAKEHRQNERKTRAEEIYRQLKDSIGGERLSVYKAWWDGLSKWPQAAHLLKQNGRKFCDEEGWSIERWIEVASHVIDANRMASASEIKRFAAADRVPSRAYAPPTTPPVREPVSDWAVQQAAWDEAKAEQANQDQSSLSQLRQQLEAGVISQEEFEERELDIEMGLI